MSIGSAKNNAMIHQRAGGDSGGGREAEVMNGTSTDTATQSTRHVLLCISESWNSQLHLRPS